MVRVKICGITTLEDAHHTVQAGADALGFVFYEASPRHISPEQGASIIKTLPPLIQVVGLFVNADAEYVNATADFCQLDIVQLHGDEAPDYCNMIRRRVIKAFRIKDINSLDPIKNYRVAGMLLDAFSLTGRLPGEPKISAQSSWRGGLHPKIYGRRWRRLPLTPWTSPAGWKLHPEEKTRRRSVNSFAGRRDGKLSVRTIFDR
jgi:N-(5'phosphoribosyl)anthranilate (PRA) isomerase